jgi:hypothetical protein
LKAIRDLLYVEPDRMSLESGPLRIELTCTQLTHRLPETMVKWLEAAKIEDECKFEKDDERRPAAAPAAAGAS